MRGQKIRAKLQALLLAACMGVCSLQVTTASAAEEKPKSVDIVFTHDTHSHLNSFRTVVDGENVEAGGFARIKTVIDEKKEENPDTLVVDGGDFSMGTLFQTVYEEEASELRMLGYLGYDATTFGNHEFDYRSKGLAQMLDTAAASVEFKDPIEAVKETVATIKEKEDVDMIVCLSHSGTSEDPKKSEDELLAKAVPELDVIISGHTHTTLEEPIILGNTAIVSAGEYGINVGSMHFSQNAEGRWEVEDYNLIPIRPDIEADEAAQEKIDAFEANIDDTYLKQFGYTASEVLCENDYEFASVDDLYTKHTEHNLGDIMADAYIYGATHTKDYDGEEIDVAVVPSGTVRDTYVPGDVTVTDVFNSFSLGIGADGVPGYPLIKVYLTGKELKTVAEIDASISDYMTTARLYCSGLNMTYNPNRLILNRVTDVYLTKNDKREEIEDDKLYCVVADLYSGQMLSAVTDMSYGLLSIVPKNADGSKVEDFEDCIIYDGDQELKAWVSIARYMESFEEGENGIAEMPEYYNGLHDRKVVDDDKSLGARLKNPNKYAAMIVGVVVLIFIIVLIVKVIRRICRRKLKKVNT